MKEKVGFIVLLLTQAAMASTDPEVVCSSKPVEAVVDQNVTLQCHFEPPLDATDMTVEWRHGHLNHIVHLYQDRKDNPAEQKEHFGGRTSLFHEGLTKGNLSLKLSSVRLSDTGRYRCSFHTDKLQNSCYVNLTVVPEGKGNRTEQIDDSTENKDNRQEQRAGSSRLRNGIIAVIVIVIIVISIVCGRRCDSAEAEGLVSCLGICVDMCDFTSE